MRSKCFVSVIALFLIHSSQGKPTEHYVTEGRGIGSTIWGWITYPFSWWSSSEPDLPPVHDQLVGPAHFGPYDNIEIAKHNVTVWCNDQTCTTMKCDKFGCKNVTCNIYDTDMRGECREYNTLKPEEPAPVKPTEPIDKVTTSVKPAEVTPTAATLTQGSSVPLVEDHPLELEAVLSSTVTEGNLDKEPPETKPNKSSTHKNKV